MGEVLHEVDFNQLQIENKQYQEKIEERNQELLRLKLKAGNTQQVLNSYKVGYLFIYFLFYFLFKSTIFVEKAPCSYCPIRPLEG